MASTVGLQPRRSLSGDSLSFMCSDFVHLRQHFPTKERCQEGDTMKSKSFYHSGDIRHGKNCNYSSLDSKKILQSSQKFRLYDLFSREIITEKDSSKSLNAKKKPSSKQTLIHSDYNGTSALENRNDDSESLQHPDANGTAHSECLLTNQRNGDIKQPVINSLGTEAARSIQVMHAPKPLSNGGSNTTMRFMDDTSRESRYEDNMKHDLEMNSVENDDDLASNQAKNRRELDEKVGQCANGKSSFKETFYDGAGDHAATASMTTVSMTNDSAASYASPASVSFHPGTENRSLGNFNSENNDAMANCQFAQETDITVRSSSTQEKLNSDKVSGSISESSSGVNGDTMKEGFNGVVDHNPRRVIRVVSLKDKDFMSRAKRNNTNCRVSRSHSSSAPHDKTYTYRSTDGGYVPPSQPLTRSDCMVQKIALRSKLEGVNAERSRMADFEEVSVKPDKCVSVEANANLLPQSIATEVGGLELWSREKEILTIEKVQGKDQLDSSRPTVKSILTGNDSLPNQASRELESNTIVVEGELILQKIYNEKQCYTPEKQGLLETGVAVKKVSENEKQNPNGSDELERGLVKVSRNNQQPLHNKSDIMQVTDDMNSECLDETLQSKDNENIKSFSQINNLDSHNLDFAELPNESSFAGKCESLGDIETLYDGNKETKNSVADVATEMDNSQKCIQSVTKMVENTSQSSEEERGSHNPQPLSSTMKSEPHFTKKQRPTRRVRRAMTGSTTSDEITEALWKFIEVSTEPGHRKYDLAQSENNLQEAPEQSRKDGARTASGGDPRSKKDSLGSAKRDALERNTYGLEPRFCMRLPFRRPLSRSNSVITDDRSYIKQLSEEVRTLLILDARQRRLSASDKTHSDHRSSMGENQSETKTERKLRLSNRSSEKVICPRYLNSIDILKLETLPLEDGKGLGKALSKEGKKEVDKTHKEELREEMSCKTSSKLGEVVSPAETSCDHKLPEMTDSVVVHEFTELISASSITNDNKYIASASPNIGSLFLNRDNDQLFESDDMLARAIKSMAILAVSEQYMKQVEAQAAAEYEELRRRPRNDGKVFLPRRPLHQKSLPENDTVPLT